ncbi:MAG: DUF2849 domain-containing protein [Jhaorihella sp.]
MKRPYSPKVVTASDLAVGDVIYLTADDRWSRALSEAEILGDEAHAQLRLIEAEQQNDRIVGAYLAEVAIGTYGPEPVHFREDFRRSGPSNYFHGKQENPGQPRP